MSEPQLEEWLDNSELPKYQRDELKAASQKQDKYVKMRSWKQISDAQNATASFINYVILQGVFIDEDISSRFMEAAVLMRKALVSRSMMEQGLGGGPGATNFRLLSAQELAPVEAMVSDVKQLVRTHLASISLPVPAVEHSTS